MKKLYRVVYIAKEENGEYYYAKDSWMIESELEIIDVYNKLEEWNEKLQAQGIDGKFTVDAEKQPIDFEQFTFESLLDNIKNL